MTTSIYVLDKTKKTAAIVNTLFNVKSSLSVFLSVVIANIISIIMIIVA